MAAGESFRRALSHRQFLLLFSGQTVSQWGDGIFAVALPLLVLSLTGSGADLGLVVGARLVPTVVFLLLGGALTDRVSRRLAMLTSDAGRALIAAALGVLALTHHLHFTGLVVGSLLFGCFDALFFPSSMALVPELLPADDLVAANAVSRLGFQIFGNMLGPLTGGLIATALGPSWPVLIDAGTFVVSAGCLLAMRPTPAPTPSGASMIADIREGLVFCRTTPWLLWTIVVAGFANALVFSPSSILMPLLFKRVLHTPNWMVGTGFAAFGLGGMVGSLVLLSVRRPRRRVTVMWIVWAGGSLACVPFGLSKWPWLCVGLVALVGLSLVWGNVLWETLMQTEVPPELLGRASSVDWLVSLALTPVGVALAGLLADHVGVRLTIVVPAAAASALAVIVLVMMPSITAIDRRPRVEDPSPL